MDLITLFAAGVDGLDAAGGISKDVLLVDLEFVLHEDPSLLLKALLKVVDGAPRQDVSQLVRRDDNG